MITFLKLYIKLSTIYLNYWILNYFILKIIFEDKKDNVAKSIKSEKKKFIITDKKKENKIKLPIKVVRKEIITNVKVGKKKIKH